MTMRKVEMMSERLRSDSSPQRRGGRPELAWAGALLALLLAPASAQAQQNAVSLGLVNSFIPASSFDPLSSDDHQARLGLQYARELLPLGPGALFAEGSYTLGSSRSELFGGELESVAFFQTVTAGAGYRLPLWSWLVPRARVGVGVLVGRLGIAAGELELSDWSAAFTGYALAGVELLWPKPWFRSRSRTIRGGLAIEGGYSFSSSLGFELEPELSESEQELRRLPLVASQLGDLALSGGQLWVSFILHF